MQKLLLILSLTIFGGKVFTMEMVSDDELLKKGQSCELAELVYMIEIVKCNQTQDEEKITVCVEKLVDQAKKTFQSLNCEVIGSELSKRKLGREHHQK